MRLFFRRGKQLVLIIGQEMRGYLHIPLAVKMVLRLLVRLMLRHSLPKLARATLHLIIS